MKAIKGTTFVDLKEKAEANQQGLVLYGCGGSLDEWVEGITKILVEKRIVSSPNWFTELLKIKTTGGRTDLVFMFDTPKVNIAKLAVWRLQWGDAGWLSDYVVNYANQHTC